jgi:hypothetical protein
MSITSPPQTLCLGSTARPLTVARLNRTHCASRLREYSGNNFASAWSNRKPAHAAGTVSFNGPGAEARKL